MTPLPSEVDEVIEIYEQQFEYDEERRIRQAALTVMADRLRWERDYQRRFPRNGDRGPSLIKAVGYSFGAALVAFGFIVWLVK